MDLVYIQVECEHSFSKMLASQQSNKTALDVTLEYFESKLETALTTLYTSEIYEVYLLHSDVTIAHPILGHSYEYSSILEYEVSPSGIKKKLIEDWFNSGSKNKKSSPSILVIAALESRREVELFEKLIPSTDELMGNVSVIFFREDKQWSMSQYDKTAEKFEGIVSGDTSYLTPISNLQIENLNRTIKFLGLSQQKSPFFMDYLVGLGGTPSSSSGAYEDDHGDDMDLDDDHQIITLGYIPKSCDAEFIQCGDELSSGTNEVNIKIKKKSGTRLEDGKLISLDSMSWWEPHNECWQYFLNEICEDHFVNQSKLKPTDLAEIWSHFLEEGNLPKHCIIVSDRDCGGEFKNENFNDGHHWYVRYYLAEDGEIYNEQIVLIRITERDLKMFSLDELVEEIKAKHSEDGLDPAIEEVFKDIENNGAGFDETKQLGYILDLYMGDGFLALHAYRLCLPFCQDEDELDYIVELITDIDESLGSKVDSDRKNAVKIIETHLVSEQDSDEDASP